MHLCTTFILLLIMLLMRGKPSMPDSEFWISYLHKSTCSDVRGSNNYVPRVKIPFPQTYTCSNKTSKALEGIPKD